MNSVICDICGSPLAAGRCPRCETRSIYRFVHREIAVLAILVGVTVAAFFLTRSFAASNHALRLQDARAWYALGEEALQRDDLTHAVDSLRRAVTKNPDAPAYRLALAGALAAGGQDDAARQLLLDVRERQAEDPDTNLQLARLEARHGEVSAAGRYYVNTLAALWKPDQSAASHAVRTEFIAFLLSHGERDRALSEALVLETHMPDDVPSRIAVGNMLLAAGDARRAADHFARALVQSPDNREALEGAAEASFDLADYSRARHYFELLGDSTDRTREIRALTELVLDSDPLAPRLRIAERRRRLEIGLAQVVRRLEACQVRSTAGGPKARAELDAVLADAREAAAGMSAPARARAPDQVEAGFDLVYRGERLGDRACGTPALLDRALVLIGRRHDLENP